MKRRTFHLVRGLILLAASFVILRSAYPNLFGLSAQITVQDYTHPDLKTEKQNYNGQYMLVSRQWESCPYSSGDILYTGTYCWRYRYDQFFDSEDAAIKWMNDRANGNVWPKVLPENFVGLYKVTRVLTSDDLDVKQGDRVTSRTVEEKEHWITIGRKKP